MLQYLNILLSDESVSFCHYNPSSDGGLMSLDIMRAGIRFAMMENLMIQFVYPEGTLPQEYLDVIDTIDHFNIKSVKDDAQVWVVNKPILEEADVPVVLRLDKQRLFESDEVIASMLCKQQRLNVVITDIETFSDSDFDAYKFFLERLVSRFEALYARSLDPQLNLLTDRIVLTQMNSCRAGETNITLASNGRFYICPAFYYDDAEDYVGDLERGLDIKERQLYRLDHAPICSHCDAYQCKRCVWLNRKLTLEVNTPSHEQCVLAHLERNASRQLLLNLRKHGTFRPETEINEIDYLDPFEKRKEWT